MCTDLQQNINEYNKKTFKKHILIATNTKESFH